MTYLLDTSSIIDFLQNRTPIVHFVQKHERDTFTTSTVCVFELWSGISGLEMKKKTLRTQQLGNMLQMLAEIIPFSPEQAKIAGAIYANLSQQGALIDDIDILIAAAALSSQATLVTGNPKHFSRISNLEIVSL